MNCSEVRTGLHAVLKKHGYNPVDYDPCLFPGLKICTRMLEQQGFRVDSIELISRLTALNTDIHGRIETSGLTFMKSLEGDEEIQREMREEVLDKLKFSQDTGI